MTPPAAARSTSAARRSAVRHPRRISGPAGRASAAAAAAAAVAIPAPGIALPRRRPVRPAVQPRPRPARKATRRPQQGTPGIALRALGALDGLSGSALLDRLIRGRAWIGLLAFALIGIVAMQLLVLELNTGVGRTLGRIATLQRQNAQLGIEDSMYSAESRVAPLAAASGMVLAPTGAIHFVAAAPVDVARAAAALSTSVQASTSGLSGTTGGGEATNGGAASAATSAGALAGGEAASSTESSSSSTTGGGESGSGSSEPSSSASSGTGTPAASSSPATAPSTASSTPTTTPPAGAAVQATGASAAPTSGTETSSPGGNTQAGARE